MSLDPRTGLPDTHNSIRLKFKKLHTDAQTPVYATPGAANFDIHAIIEGESKTDKAGQAQPPSVTVSPGNAVHIRTGLAFEVPPGWVLAVYSRSGHGFKDGVRLSNAVGQCDSDYRGEVMVALHNDGRKRFTVKHGDRIAQARLEPAPKVELMEIGGLSETARGTGGFGSTGS